MRILVVSLMFFVLVPIPARSQSDADTAAVLETLDSWNRGPSIGANGARVDSPPYRYRHGRQIASRVRE
jgi:hypothetical protein